VAKLHYWTHLFQDDDDETSLSTAVPLVTLSSAVRSKDDTFLRAVVWAEVSATVGTASLPNLDWLAGSTVDMLYFFDTESDGHAVNLIDDDPYTLGFQRLNQTMWLTNTANKYTVLWQGPPQGLNLEGARKGYSAANLPSFSAQRWVSDNRGVFDNFAGFSVLFSSRLAGRILWASDLPAP
jgi:hypothetical protein